MSWWSLKLFGGQLRYWKTSTYFFLSISFRSCSLDYLYVTVGLFLCVLLYRTLCLSLIRYWKDDRQTINTQTGSAVTVAAHTLHTLLTKAATLDWSLEGTLIGLLLLDRPLLNQTCVPGWSPVKLVSWGEAEEGTTWKLPPSGFLWHHDIWEGIWEEVGRSGQWTMWYLLTLYKQGWSRSPCTDLHLWIRRKGCLLMFSKLLTLVVINLWKRSKFKLSIDVLRFS